MELLGGDLHNDIQKHRLGHLPPETCGRFLKHVVSGLMHLHSRKLIHRDIKPGNIFVSGDTAKIGDFGLTVEAGPTLAVCGTPNSEQFGMGRSDELQGRHLGHRMRFATYLH